MLIPKRICFSDVIRVRRLYHKIESLRAGYIHGILEVLGLLLALGCRVEEEFVHLLLVDV